MTALLQALEAYFRLHCCRSGDVVRLSTFDASLLVLDGAVQPVLTELLYTVRRLEKSMNSAHDSLSFKDTKNTAELIAELLRPGGYATVVCTAQRCSVWRTPFRMHNSMQDSGSFSPSVLTKKEKVYGELCIFDIRE